MTEEVKDLLIPHLVFTKDWRNRDHFPTYEPSEEQVRSDMQYLYEEIKKYLNENVAGTLCKTLQEHMNKPVVTNVEFTDAGIEGDDITLKLEVTTSDDKKATTECLLKDLAEAMREELGSGIKSVEYDSEDRSWVFSYTDGRVDRVALPKEETGIALVSLDTPGAEHTPATGFVVGQQWLRPGFTVDNHALQEWEVTKGTVETGEHRWAFTADGSTGTFAAEQALESIGEAGQKIYVMLLADDIADHQTSLAVSLNGESHDLKTGGGVFETALDNEGNLLIVVNGTWSYAASAATVTLKHLEVVNSDAIEMAAVDCKPLSDWPGFIERYAPFEQVIMPRTMFVQTAPGNWVPTDYEVLPATRGGLGLGTFTKGQMFYADSDRTLAALEPPTEDESVLLFEGDKPEWYTKEQFIASYGQLRLMCGSYTGNAANRTLDIGIEPKLLYIYPTPGPTHYGNSGAIEFDTTDNPVVLANGSTAGETNTHSTGDGSAVYMSTVKLSGSSLIFGAEAIAYYNQTKALLANRSGVIYNWVAIY